MFCVEILPFYLERVDFSTLFTLQPVKYIAQHFVDLNRTGLGHCLLKLAL